MISPVRRLRSPAIFSRICEATLSVSRIPASHYQAIENDGELYQTNHKGHTDT